MPTYTYNFRAYKDPDAVLDFKIDWSAPLSAVSDSIATSQWIADAGITIDSESNDSNSATVWLSAGVAGSSYAVTNRITTAAGRTDDRTILVSVVER